jgi:cold shock protein
MSVGRSLDGKRAAVVATGRVLQFDEERGYGFIAADDGGEDVFLHASVFDGDSRQLVPGLPVEFETMAGDRGRKAFGVHALKTNRTAAVPDEEAGVQTAPVQATDDDEGLCDVLSEARFGQEITEILLDAAPDMTGRHIVQVRQSMIAFGRKHGWIDS